MGSIHKLLNVALPLITLIVLPIFMVPFLIFKLLLAVKTLVCRESLAGKAVLITGAASGMGEDVNFWGPVYGTVFAIPHLKRSKGKIVVMASACGRYPLPRLSIYNASKAALINFFETVTMELGSTVGITIVTPGPIKSNMTSWDNLSKLMMSQVRMEFIALQSAAECAKAIIDGVRKGKMYVTEPSWMKVLFPWKLLCPQVIDIGNRLAFRISPNTLKRKDANENVYLSQKIDQPKAE